MTSAIYRARGLLTIFILLAGIMMGSVQSASADTWAIGSIVGLCRGTQIRTGPGLAYYVHTIVPENSWAVKIINGPRSADGQEWWDTSRKEAGDPSGGTGWVYRSQATACLGGQPPPPPPAQAASIVLTSDLVISNLRPAPGQAINAAFRAKNVGGQTFSARYFGVKGRDANNGDYSFYWFENFTLAPGQEFRYDTNRSLDHTGSFWFTPNYSPDGSNWSDVKWPDGRTSYVNVIVLQPIPPAAPGQLEIANALSLSGTKPNVNQSVTARFSVRNTGGQPLTMQRLNASARGPGAHSQDWTAREVDFPSVQNITLQPGQTYTFQQSRSFDQAGDYFAEPTWQDGGGEWHGIPPFTRVWFDVAQPVTLTPTPVPQQPGQLEVAEALSLSSTTPNVNQTVTARFRVRNTGGQPVTMQRLNASARGPDARSQEWVAREVDFPSVQNITLQPGQTYTFQQSRSFDQAGDYFAEPTWQDGSGEWHGIPSFTRVWFDVAPVITVTPVPPQQPGQLEIADALTLSSTTPKVNSSVTARFSVRNTGGQPVTMQRLNAGGRGPDARSQEWAAREVDFPSVQNLTLQPGQTYAYQQSRSFDQPGEYFAEPIWQDSGGEWHGIPPFTRVWFDVTPENIPAPPPDITITPTPVRPPPPAAAARLAVEGDMTVSNLKPEVGEAVTVEFTVRNVGGQSITVQRLNASARGPDARRLEWNAPEVDFPALMNISFNSRVAYTYHMSRSFSAPGEYFIEPTYQDAGGQWHGIEPNPRIWIEVHDKATVPPPPPPRRDSIRFPLGDTGTDPTQEGFALIYPFGSNTRNPTPAKECFGKKPLSELIHAGEDWFLSSSGSAKGKPVHVIADGRVSEIASSDYPGYAVLINHEGEGVWALYGHITLARMLRAGDSVTRGEVLGKILYQTDPWGNDNSHLHFEVHNKNPLTTHCMDGSITHYNAAGYVLEKSEFATSGHIDPSKFILDRLGSPGFARPLVYQSIGTIKQDERQSAGEIAVADKQADLTIALRWPGSTLDLSVTDPNGRVVDEAYPGVTWTREATQLRLSVKNPVSGKWSTTVVGKAVSEDDEPYSITAHTEKAGAITPPDNGAGALAFVLAVVGVAALFMYASGSRPPAVRPGQPFLQLARGQTARAQYGLGRPVVLIGRDRRAQIALRDPQVSQRHARIVATHHSHVLEDLQSRNGTFVNGQPVKRHRLQDGDRLRVGTTEFRYVGPHGASRSRTDAAQSGVGVQLADGHFVAIRHDSLTIGRDPGCDLRLNDRQVSRRHARIVRHSSGYAIHDLDSPNGVRVQGRKVESVLLRDGDRIEIGRARLVFRQTSAPPSSHHAPGGAKHVH
ncbi:MAG: FHA domain-containing protein [Chloroflexi bacterium]|nr:FHA domain-containing protein [Chloroflexota bacterium]